MGTDAVTPAHTPEDGVQRGNGGEVTRPGGDRRKFLRYGVTGSAALAAAGVARAAPASALLPPEPHASTHAAGGSDPVTPAAIGAAVAAHSHGGAFQAVNVKDHGAVGDGVNDDRPAIQAAIDAASATGGGVVYLPPGAYRVTTAGQAADPAYRCGVQIPSNVTLRGAGRGATIIRLADRSLGMATGQTVAVVMGRLVGGGGISNVAVEDLTIDGNGGNQTANHGGLWFRKLNKGRIRNVEVRDCRGDALSGIQETMHFEAQASSDIDIDGCAVLATSSSFPTASGFSVGYSTGVRFRGCVASKMSVANGFTCHRVSHVTYSDCWAFSNAANGFNCEESFDVTYIGCTGGGRTPNNVGNESYPHPANTDLGNGWNGFGITFNSVRVTVTGCVSADNVGNAFLFTSGSQASADGCVAVNNALDGFVVENHDRALLSGCRSVGNRFGILFIGTAGGQISGCVVSNNTQRGIFLQTGVSGVGISGCSVTNNADHGIVADGATKVVISGCRVTNNLSGIVYFNTVTGGEVIGCAMTDNANWGFYADATAQPGVVVKAPRYANNGIADIGVPLGNLTGYPNPSSQPAVPSSATNYSNPYSHDATVYVSGGTVTSVAVAGRTTGLTAGCFRVPAGSTITLAYTAPPSWAWSLD